MRTWRVRERVGCCKTLELTRHCQRQKKLKQSHTSRWNGRERLLVCAYIYIHGLQTYTKERTIFDNTCAKESRHTRILLKSTTGKAGNGKGGWFSLSDLITCAGPPQRSERQAVDIYANQLDRPMPLSLRHVFVKVEPLLRIDKLDTHTRRCTRAINFSRSRFCEIVSDATHE